MPSPGVRPAPFPLFLNSLVTGMLRSGITYFTTVFNSEGFYSLMVLFYSIPALPLLLMQSAFDRHFDMKFSAKRTFLFRIATALSIMGEIRECGFDRDNSCVGQRCV